MEEMTVVCVRLQAGMSCMRCPRCCSYTAMHGLRWHAGKAWRRAAARHVHTRHPVLARPCGPRHLSESQRT